MSIKKFDDFLNEGISADQFTKGLVGAMQKTLPKDRWTASYKDGEIVVKNDFEETASYRIETFESNEGKFHQPNIPAKGSLEESVNEGDKKEFSKEDLEDLVEYMKKGDKDGFDIQNFNLDDYLSKGPDFRGS